MQGFNKNKSRAGMDDDKVAAILHTHGLKKLTENPQMPFASTDLVLDIEAALRHNLR